MATEVETPESEAVNDGAVESKDSAMERKPRSRGRFYEENLPKFEQDIRRLITKRKKGIFTLACSTSFTSDDCVIEAVPIFMDRNGDVKIEVDGTGGVWIIRAMIVAVELPL